MKCELCDEPAFCQCVYGLYEYKSKPQTEKEQPIIIPRGDDPLLEKTLCQFHLKELWSKIHGPCNAGMMHFEIRKPNEN